MFNNVHTPRGAGPPAGRPRRIMVHTAISRYRKLKPMVLVEDMAENDMDSGASINANNLEVNDQMKLVQQLPQVYRSVFNLYAIEGYSHQEIGTKLGITELLSRTTLYRARNILKEKLMQLTSNERRYSLAGYEVLSVNQHIGQALSTPSLKLRRTKPCHPTHNQ